MSITELTTTNRVHTDRAPITGEETKIAIPLGGLDVSRRHDALFSGRERRVKNPRATTGQTCREGHSLGRYSSSCTYHKYEYTLRVESWCRIAADGHTLDYSIDVGRGANHGVRTGHLVAPRGWVWADHLGPHIHRVGKPDENYHISAGEIIDGDGDRLTPRHFANVATANAKVRRANARANTALQRDNRALAARVIRDNPLVMVQDSIRAGNCPAGTVRFAASAGIATDRLYASARANRLRRVAARTGQTARLEPAIVAAWQRENLVCI